MNRTLSFSQEDRFIKPRPNENIFNPFSNNQMHLRESCGSSYSQLIKKNLFGVQKSPSQEITSSASFSSNPIKNLDINMPASNLANQGKNVLSPVKILDVPTIRDDFYLNLIDWHSKGPLAIALNDEAYIYTPAESTKITKVFNTYISSVKFHESLLSVGLSNGTIELYDLERLSIVRSIKNHSLRVTSLDYSSNFLISGSKDHSINLNDLRVKDSLFKKFNSHNGEICTIKVKTDQTNIFASGANDSKVCIFDIRSCETLATLKEHKGAVKAISWCPWKTNTLATGGGKADRTVKIWNQNLQVVCEKQLKSQISGLEWNFRHNFLVSSHGINSNQICVWNWDGQDKLSKLNGSKDGASRVISLIQSKQEDMVCTLSSDKSLKFFQFKDTEKSKKRFYESEEKKHDNFRRIL